MPLHKTYPAVNFFPPGLLDTDSFIFVQDVPIAKASGPKGRCGCFGAYIAMKRYERQHWHYDYGVRWFRKRCIHFGIPEIGARRVLKYLAFVGAQLLPAAEQSDLIVYGAPYASPFGRDQWKHEPAYVMAWFNDWVNREIALG